MRGRSWTTALRPNLYEGAAFTPNSQLFYLSMQGLWYSFNMFDALSWLTRDMIMGRIALLAQSDMEKTNHQWREKEGVIGSDATALC